MTVSEETPLIGRQEPTIHVVPEYVATSGDEAVALAAQAGLDLDPWQRLILRDGLGERADGSWAAFEAAMIVARQNGKGGVFEARVLAGLFLLDERLILYSAHEFKTAQEMFRRIEDLISGTAQFRKRVKRVDRTRGEEGVELLPTPQCPKGQRLRFVARSTGSGRGFTGHCNIWDESQHLSNASVDALMPTMSAIPNPQLWYGGSAPDKDLAPCEQITRVRTRALSDKPGRLAYFEWSAELHTPECERDCTEHDDPDSPLTWAKTNPGLGIRLSVEHIANERDSMSERGFARERLSVGNYPTVGGGWKVIPQPAFEAVADETSRPLDPVAFTVEVAPDRQAAAIAVAGLREDGLLHTEVVAYQPGTSWAPGRLAQLVAKWRPCVVAIAPAGPTGSLAPDINDALEELDEDVRMELTLIKGRDSGAACGGLYDAIVRPRNAPPDWTPSVRIRPHPALTAAVAGASRRYLGDAWVWDRRAASVDPSPLIAVTLARWAFLTRPPEEDEPAQPWAVYV
ncbi:terminase [Actinomadura sp. KC216]|uniref:terminase n=1 Tax=Actinomadura sp. KC216 TaxID=2530370 RepID=UPI0010475DE3|nr:terminase [Actinomadura sp. KC216]TDB88343.1 terminase [Actinomadura sp. KC216]